jgi:hypothetical protein
MRTLHGTFQVMRGDSTLDHHAIRAGLMSNITLLESPIPMIGSDLSDRQRRDRTTF